MFKNNFHILFFLLFVFFLKNISTNPVPSTTTPQECRENETYMECGPCDQARCYTIYYFINPCQLNKCSPPGCYCVEGYGRKSVDDDSCVLLSECKKEKIFK